MLIDMLDDGTTFLDDEPATPAPLFAVRAFKTAIFGTPKSVDYQAQSIEAQQSRQQDLNKDDTKVRQEPARSVARTHVEPGTTSLPSRKSFTAPDLPSDLNYDPLASPTKGILLTPGTAATRRKTVSFSARKEFRERTKSPENAADFDNNGSKEGCVVQHPISEPQRKQSALTRTLIEMSTKRSSPPMQPTKPTESAAQSQMDNLITDESVQIAPKLSQPTVDITLDLSQPRSRSGQHWKFEYDEYHKKSTREMKKIIQYGQNVKSYAAKKDLEATRLNEKLQKELAKVARIESRTSKLGKQLRAANIQGPAGDSEQARLVGELAQQTAMTVRYQIKADQYRQAIQRQPANGTIPETGHVPQESIIEHKENPGDLFEAATMQAQLESLRETAGAAENIAVRLEMENKHLKRNLARVKQEMMSYESRRQAREERLKKREEWYKASKEQCENELANLKMEHQKLLQTSQNNEKRLVQNTLPIGDFHIDHFVKPSEIPNHPIKRTDPQHNTTWNRPRKESVFPRKKRSQKAAIDVWTLGSPHNDQQQPTPKNESTELAPSSVKQDIGRALKEIDYNLVPLEPDAPPQQAVDSKGPSHSETILSINKSLSTERIANDLIEGPTSCQLPQSPIGRSASLLSRRVSSRANTMGSARTSSLSAERAAAAKARLAERKKSGEKKTSKRTGWRALDEAISCETYQ